MMDNYDAAKRFDERHNVFVKLNNAFTRTGGCGHDLGIIGAVAIIQQWEKMRTEAAARDLASLTLHRE